ncbi:MAG: histidine phosphatase family protein [Spirochaetia bacterium]|jgi:broad specificity phosphatase PhoE
MPDLRTFPGTADFYFIRHGQSESNRDGIIQGRLPSRLTEEGRSQARAAGGWFAGKALDLVLTSPLARASETADIIGAETGVTVLTVPELIEIDTGIFSGLTFAQAEERHPGDWRAFQGLSWEAVPEAERIEALVRRAELVWSRLTTLALEGRTRVLCVSHGGFLQWLIRCTLGGRTWMPLFGAAGNCCVSHLKVVNTQLAGGERGHLATWMLINALVG